jgi:hypothetical protein
MKYTLADSSRHPGRPVRAVAHGRVGPAGRGSGHQAAEGNGQHFESLLQRPRRFILPLLLLFKLLGKVAFAIAVQHGSGFVDAEARRNRGSVEREIHHQHFAAERLQQHERNEQAGEKSLQENTIRCRKCRLGPRFLVN